MLANLLEDNNKIKPKRKKHLYFLGFIKFIAMIKIIKWHIFPWNKRYIDYGARMCEILFISSGFLIGYNYSQIYMPSTYEQSVKYTYKHFRNFYPLLVLNTLFVYFFSTKINDITNIEILLSELLMIKSWSRFTYLLSRLSGISWFLSVLLFCYFLTPLLINGIKNIKKSLILIILIIFLRILTEEIIRHGKLNIYDVHFHRGPIIRLLDFYIGMLLSPSFFLLKSYMDNYKQKKFLKYLFTLFQLLFPFLIYCIMKKYDKILHRCYFVLILSVFIFIFGFDYGYLSDIIAKKFSQKIMSCQMEMYLIKYIISFNF